MTQIQGRAFYQIFFVCLLLLLLFFFFENKLICLTAEYPSYKLELSVLNLAMTCEGCYGKDFVLSKVLDIMNNMDVSNSKDYKSNIFT